MDHTSCDESYYIRFNPVLDIKKIVVNGRRESIAFMYHFM